MQVCDFPQGRYGNAIFRYLASSLFCILYGAQRIYEVTLCDIVFSDIDFIDWSNQVLNDQIPSIDTTKKYLFQGYYQHDAIFLKYKSQLIDHIEKNSDDLLITDGYKPGGTGIYHYTVAQYVSKYLLHCHAPFPIYDIVVHLRLEDFVYVNQVLHPKCISDVLDNFANESMCFVVNVPTTLFEHRYINYFKEKYNIVLQSNDLIIDYHIMKNAKVIVCSRSTMCWSSIFFSNTVKTVFFPHCVHASGPHETFRTPIENTIPYNVHCATEHEINLFLDTL